MINKKIFHLEDRTLLTIPYGRNVIERILTIFRTHLYQILIKACQSYNNISINFGHILQDIDVNLRLIKFIVPQEKRQSLISTDVLIGADGIIPRCASFWKKEHPYHLPSHIFPIPIRN